MRKASGRWIERRLTSVDTPLSISAPLAIAVLAAMAVTSVLFVAYGANPLIAFFMILHEPFATANGFGYTLVRATPLLFIVLGTIVSWRSGFAYLGFEGCFVMGAAAAAWLALATRGAGWFGQWLGAMPFLIFLLLVLLASFVAGGLWAGLVGLLRVRLGGNEVLLSLMSKYIAIFFVQYLVSGPMRAPGGLPETAQMPRATWLPFLFQGIFWQSTSWRGTRAYIGILFAVAAAGLVWLLLQKTHLGYELLVTGFKPRAADMPGFALAIA